MKATKPSFILIFSIGLAAPLFSGDCFAGKAARQADNGLTPLSVIVDAFANRQSNLQITQEGPISRILSDDTVGDRHQRLIVRLGNGQTLLITHNIDLAPRVPNPVIGKTLRFCGEYEWNDEGGVVHWTHMDPEGRHVEGWLEYEGRRYYSLDSQPDGVLNRAPNSDTRGAGRTAAKRAVMFSISERALFDLRGRAAGRVSPGRAGGIYFFKAPE